MDHSGIELLCDRITRPSNKMNIIILPSEKFFFSTRLIHVNYIN